jgi:hypothetical protein
MHNVQAAKQSNALPVDEKMLAKALESKSDSESGRPADMPVSNNVSANASLITALQNRASQLLAEAEALVQRISFATKDQIPELSKKLKQIANDLKQIASRHKMMKSNSAPMPTVNISAIGLSVSSSSQAIPSPRTSINIQATSNHRFESAETTVIQAEGVTNLQAKTISSYASVEKASLLDVPNETEWENEESKRTGAGSSNAQTENTNDGILGALKQIKDAVKLAAMLLEKRVNDIEDKDERKQIEANLRDVKSDMKDVDKMIGVSAAQQSRVILNQIDTLSLPLATETNVSDVTVNSLNTQV